MFAVTCSCMLTKEAIVRHYSSLERNLENVDDIIERFGRFNGFNEPTKFSFMKLLCSPPGSKTEEFLRKLLDLSHTRIHLCLLENEMSRTNPLLLKQVTEVHVHTGNVYIMNNVFLFLSFNDMGYCYDIALLCVILFDFMQKKQI